MVDRYLRRAELQAASFHLTASDESDLRSSLLKRKPNEPEVDQLLKKIRLTFDRDAGNPFFTTVAFEFTGEASLSWYLTGKEKREILTAADGLDERIRLLLDWWHAPAAQGGEIGK